MTKRELRNLHALAKAQRWQLWSFVLGLILAFLVETGDHPRGHWPDIVTGTLMIVAMACGLSAMISSLVLLWHLYPSYGAYSIALLLFLIPYVNLVIWIAMQVHAIRVLRAAGVKVGLLGADLSSLPPPPMIKT